MVGIINNVFLIGAGPGDPDLITVKAAKAIASADVILTDRLVSTEIVGTYASDYAEIVYVGKECSKNASTPQKYINEIMVSYALQGRKVVRLKGGDVSFFSNVLDELEALKSNGIPYEIIPGITAASGAAAYSGIPLTARGYTTAVRFLTFYKSEILTETYWQEIAATNDTLVFYMSIGNLSPLVENLRKFGISNEKEIAVIEQATTPFQRVHTSTFEDFETKLKGKEFISPSLVIIGKVVKLHKEFQWLEENENFQTYFPTVANKNNEYLLNSLQYAV